MYAMGRSPLSDDLDGKGWGFSPVEAFQLLSPAGNKLNFVSMVLSNLDSSVRELLERT